jgi:hypothetical protein
MPRVLKFRPEWKPAAEGLFDSVSTGNVEIEVGGSSVTD